MSVKKKSSTKKQLRVGIPQIFQNTGIFVGSSSVHGRGVFAARSFKEGDIIEIAPLITITRNTEAVQHTELRHYVFAGYDDNTTVIALGYASLYNHSDKENAEFETLNDVVIVTAMRNIKKGDEIFVDYNWAESEWQNPFAD